MKTATLIPGAHLGRTPEGGKGKHNHFVLFLHYLGKCRLLPAITLLETNNLDGIILWEPVTRSGGKPAT